MFIRYGDLLFVYVEMYSLLNKVMIKYMRYYFLFFIVWFDGNQLVVSVRVVIRIWDINCILGFFMFLVR